MQMARSQALTVLLALLTSDPGEVILDSIYSSGLVNSILRDLIESPHTSLLQVWPVSAHGMFVIVSDLMVLSIFQAEFML